MVQRTETYTDYVQTDAGKLGTGITVGSGAVLTDLYVIASAHSSVAVRFSDGRVVTATRFVWDERRDLALILTTATDEPAMPAPTLASLRSPEPLFVIGYPRPDAIGSAAPSVSQGIFSGTWQNAQGVSFIQTDARIDPGNSGGPVIDAAANVVGIADFIICANVSVARTLGGCGATGLDYATSMSEVTVWFNELAQQARVASTATPDASKPTISIVALPDGTFHVRVVGFPPNESLTEDLDAATGTCTLKGGGRCEWHFQADAQGVFDHDADFSGLPPGQYWYSVHGDQSARFAPTTSIVIQ